MHCFFEEVDSNMAGDDCKSIWNENILILKQGTLNNVMFDHFNDKSPLSYIKTHVPVRYQPNI